MKRVIFTTVQNNLEARKMLELTLKSFYAFNSGFDFKVYCLDNSKDSFEEYFNKFNFENLEFINFKDGTKWNNYLEHLENDELTELEKKNIFISDPEMYTFDTSVCISKLEITDLLLEKYDLVIASDIDIVFVNPISKSLNAFLQSGKFLGAVCESINQTTSNHKMSFSASFMYFNKDSKDRVLNLMDKALYSLKYEDLREIPSFNKVGFDGTKFCFSFFEQDLLDYFIKDYFLLNNFIANTSVQNNNFLKYLVDLDNFELIHFAGSFLKPFYKFDKANNVNADNNYLIPLRTFYSNLFKVFNVDIDFINKQIKFTTCAINIHKFYCDLIIKIKKRLKN